MSDGVTVLIDRAVAGRYADTTIAALTHAVEHAGIALPVGELPTRGIDRSFIDDPGAGVVIGPGSPYDDPGAVVEVVRSARERGVPLVGT